MNFLLQKLHITVAVLVAFSFAATKQLHSQSFDCSSVLNEVEQVICYDAHLSALDTLLSDTYSKAPDTIVWTDINALRKTQIEWLQQRNACRDDHVCIREAYVSRLKILAGSVLDLHFVEDGTSYIYEGEPHDRQCGAGQSLSEWGDCVTWLKGGAGFKGISVGGDMAYEFYSVAANMHSCSLSGLAARTNTGWLAQLEQCEVNISLDGNSLELKTNGQCNDYCGLRAQGHIDRVFAY